MYFKVGHFCPHNVGAHMKLKLVSNWWVLSSQYDEFAVWLQKIEHMLMSSPYIPNYNAHTERNDYISATDDAMAAAHTHLNIPRLLSAEDFTR